MYSKVKPKDNFSAPTYKHETDVTPEKYEMLAYKTWNCIYCKFTAV